MKVYAVIDTNMLVSFCNICLLNKQILLENVKFVKQARVYRNMVLYEFKTQKYCYPDVSCASCRLLKVYRPGWISRSQFHFHKRYL